MGEPRHSYRGEHAFPLIIQNIHRYFLFFALLLLVFLAHDAWTAMRFVDPATGAGSLGVGVGTIVLTGNVVLLGLYTFSCHSLRHIVGGCADCLGDRSARRTAYDCVSGLNAKYMWFAWASLVWVGFSDVYVRMLSMGVWSDWRFF